MSDKGKYCVYHGRWGVPFELGSIDRETPQFYWMWELYADGSGEGKGRTRRHDRGEVIALYSSKDMAVERVNAATTAWEQHELAVKEAEQALARAKEKRRDAALAALKEPRP